MSNQLAWICPNCSKNAIVPTDAKLILCTCGYSSDGQFRPVPNNNYVPSRTPSWEVAKRQAICFECDYYEPARGCKHNGAGLDCGCRRAHSEKLADPAGKCPAEKWEGTNRARFVRTTELVDAAGRLAELVPPDVGRIVGVPRSGMIPAAVIATRLHLPLFTIASGQVVSVGGGSRMDWGEYDRPGWTLVVDDTVHNGGSIAKFRSETPEIRGSIFAAVYIRDEGSADIFAEQLPTPHLLEWNLFNSAYINLLATDLDGIICHNPPDQNRPRYLAGKLAPVRSIITARPKSERNWTVRQLREWGVQYERLEMWAGPEAARWDVDQVATWKAAKVIECGAEFYIESEPPLADAIRSHGIRVLCPDQGFLA